jgi:hypothetical protein
VIVVLSGGRHDLVLLREEPTPALLMLDAYGADRIVTEELPSLDTDLPPLSEEQLDAAIARLTPPPPAVSAADLEQSAPPSEPMKESVEPISAGYSEIPETLAMSDSEMATISQRLERLAEQSPGKSRTEYRWREDGKQYSAVLVREPSNDGTALEGVVAKVSTSAGDKELTTIVNLRRLAFSQFTQMVDHWDPMVQIHDDEVVGRFHSNSQIKLLSDSRTTPKFFGKVTTAARDVDTESRSRRRKSEIFQGGIETRAGRIRLPESPHPFAWAPVGENARVHEFTSNAHLRFYGDGSYTWTTPDSPNPQYVRQPSDGPLYFVAAPKTTLYVQGVVAGRVLVYSPYRIVVEGNLTYAHDPRDAPASGDYLGLVSDRLVEVAPPGVTGPGDLKIDAAIYAGRQFGVTSIESPRSGTLRIFGSLAAGSLTATEPRYATKIEYDSRFERQRPPGFPSTDRYEAAEWDGQWAVDDPT